jgi:hypothetical protein
MMPCRARMSLWLGALLIAAAPCWPATQNLELHLPASPSDPKMPEIMKDLADRVLPVYEEPDRQRYLATLSALQLVDGNTQAALSTRQDLRNLRKGADPTYPADRSVAYDIYARARNVQAHDKVAFDKAFVQSYRDMVPQLSDKDARCCGSWNAIGPINRSASRRRWSWSGPMSRMRHTAASVH